MFAKKRERGWALAITVLAGLGLATAVYCFINSLELKLTVSGGEKIGQEYGLEYVDAGAEAKVESSLISGFHIPVDVTTQVTVDPEVVGSYSATYQAEFLWLSAMANREIIIMDTVAPTLTLTEDTAEFWLPGSEFVEPGFSAYDDYDGDITHLVSCERNDNIITYTVEDSSGNRTSAQRVINFDDPVPPQLILNGDSEMLVYLGRPYEEPGFSATDNYDGDLTQKVTVEGAVDVYTQGSYCLTYTVADTFGNTACVQRTVRVEPVPELETVIPNGKVIYLTFDDGPSRYTPKLLEILRKYNVKATFFVVDTSYIHLLPEIVAEGHSIGVHTGSHDYKEIYADEQAYFQDFKTIYDKIYNLTGIKTTLMRFPGGSSNVISNFNPGIMTRLTRLVTDYGLQYFDWNVDSRDAWQSKTAQQVFQSVVTGIGDKSCSVVLQHDIHEHSVDAVERIIQWGLGNGYQFLPLDATSPGFHHDVRN